MTNNMITAARFTAAADALLDIRDRALEFEREMRADDSLATFAEALELALDPDFVNYSPDTLDAIRALLITLND